MDSIEPPDFLNEQVKVVGHQFNKGLTEAEKVLKDAQAQLEDQAKPIAEPAQQSKRNTKHVVMQQSRSLVSRSL